MKFGVVIHKPTMNLGDDIQTYAAAKLLPHVDYQIDREYISDFKSENDEPVAVIMNAWWMWKKWNWPPADCIIPKLLSMHINNYGVARKSSPIYAEWAQGCGGEFFKKYGPVGCRDMASLDFFKEQGIDCYFSGCLTLTIPKQEKTEDAGTYVCLVDLNDKIRAKAMEYLKEHGREPKAIYHSDPDAVYAREYTFDLSKIQPVAARPDFVDDVVPAKEVCGVRIDEAFLGSCNNGRIEDLRVGAEIIRGKKVAEGVRFPRCSGKSDDLPPGIKRRHHRHLHGGRSHRHEPELQRMLGQLPGRYRRE